MNFSYSNNSHYFIFPKPPYSPHHPSHSLSLTASPAGSVTGHEWQPGRVSPWSRTNQDFSPSSDQIELIDRELAKLIFYF